MDTLVRLSTDRGIPLTVSTVRKHRGLDWDALRARVAQGMRNATLMATAPNANIGLVAATTPGMDPRFAQVFSRNKISGKYLDINHNLVKDLMNLGLWEKVKDRIVELQGDISSVTEIPEHIRNIYKTSFTTSPYAFIEVAARAQKWIDQGISRNMYLDTRDIDEVMRIYMSAWEKGLKTTYYLHMKPRHTAEQSTVAVNKAAKLGKVGFGAIRKAAEQEAPVVIPASALATEPVHSIEIDTPIATPIADRMTSSSISSSVATAMTTATATATLTQTMPQVKIATQVAPQPVASSSTEKKGFSSISSLAQRAQTVRGGFGSVPKAHTPAATIPATAAPVSASAPVGSEVKPKMSIKPGVMVVGAKTCPTDPAELAQCDSCQ